MFSFRILTLHLGFRKRRGLRARRALGGAAGGEEAGPSNERETVKGWEERGLGEPGRKRGASPCQPNPTQHCPAPRRICHSRGSQGAPREAGREGQRSGGSRRPARTCIRDRPAQPIVGDEVSDLCAVPLPLPNVHTSEGRRVRVGWQCSHWPACEVSLPLIYR